MKNKKWRIPRKVKKKGRIMCYIGSMLSMVGPITWWIEHNEKCKICKHNDLIQKFRYQHKKWTHDNTPLYTNPKPPKQKALKGSYTFDTRHYNITNKITTLCQK